MITARTAFTILISRLSRKPTNKESPFSAKSGAVLRDGAGSAGNQIPKAGTAHPKVFWLTTTPISSNIPACGRPKRRGLPLFFIQNLRSILPSLRHTAAAGTDSAAGRTVCPANRRFEIRPTIRRGDTQTAIIRLPAPVRQQLRVRRRRKAHLSKI